MKKTKSSYLCTGTNIPLILCNGLPLKYYVNLSHDGTFPMDGASIQWAQEMTKATVQIGRPWPKGPELKLIFEEVGFVNVQVRELWRPTNDWPKDPHMKEIGKVSCILIP